MYSPPVDGHALFLSAGYYKAAVGMLSQVFVRMHAFPLHGYTSKSRVGQYMAVFGLSFKDTTLF